jgi:hypothetical protein
MNTDDSFSSAVPFPRATIELKESEIPSILKSFRSFVGDERLKRRIELADKMIASASPTQRRLRFRGSAIDFVAKQDMAEERTRLKAELPPPSVSERITRVPVMSVKKRRKSSAVRGLAIRRESSNVSVIGAVNRPLIGGSSSACSRNRRSATVLVSPAAPL